MDSRTRIDMVRFAQPSALADSLSLGANGTPAILAVAGALAIAAGALPLHYSAIFVIAVPLLLLAWTVPRVGLVLFLLSIPFSSWTKVTLGEFDVTATDVLVGILLSSWLGRGIARQQLRVSGGPIVGIALALLGAALLSSLAAVDFPDAVKELIKLAEMIAMAIYAASVLTGPDDTRVVLLALIAAGAAEAMVGLYQFVTGSGPEAFAIGPFMRAYGDFAQPNGLAGYLAMILPFGVVLSVLPRPGWPTGWHRGLIIAATLIIAVGLVATLSRGGWLGSAAGLAVMALLWSAATRRALMFAIAGVAVAVVVASVGVLPLALIERVGVVFEYFRVFDVRTVAVTPTNFALVERMAHWQAAWTMAMDHPLIGVGPGNYEAAYPSYAVGQWVEPLGHAHNYYLNTFAEMGVIGLTLLLAFMATIFVRIATGIARAGASLARVWPNETASDDRRDMLRRAALVGALGGALTLSVHNSFDNIFVHGIGVQFGLILGLVEVWCMGFRGGLAPERETDRSTPGTSRAHRG
ncbi:MAG: hypothetical protein GEU73_08510 [Chloroflexi bacterium]|nr:hypothetical protein [Chloroflexota bacterium]